MSARHHASQHARLLAQLVTRHVRTVSNTYSDKDQTCENDRAVALY